MMYCATNQNVLTSLKSYQRVLVEQQARFNKAEAEVGINHYVTNTHEENGITHHIHCCMTSYPANIYFLKVIKLFSIILT